MKVLSKLHKTQSVSKAQGSQVVEYALLIGLVAIPASVGLYFLGNQLQNFFVNIGNMIGSLQTWY